MKKYVMDFFRRGLISCGFGPLVLAVLYWILHQQGIIETLSVNQVCLSIFSISALAFMAGAMNFIYQVERLPLMFCILIHGAVLYLGYLSTYLMNGWLKRELTSFIVFTCIFIAGYLIIWGIIYCVIKRKTDHMNETLKKAQEKG